MQQLRDRVVRLDDRAALVERQQSVAGRVEQLPHDRVDVCGHGPSLTP
jgi:hypothetical protein